MPASLVQQARITAAARTAPQKIALAEALQQAIADRNAALRAATVSNHGINVAIHQAKPELRHAYGDALSQGASVTGMTAGLTGAAGARENAVGVARIAESRANALADLSDRRISAAAGAAYQRGKALADYVAEKGKLGTKQDAIAAQEGLYASDTLNKLEQHASDQAFQANQQGQRLSAQSHENALSRRNSRINAAMNREATSGRAQAQQDFTAHQNALSRRQQKLGRIDTGRRQTQRLEAQAKAQAKKAAEPKLTATEVKGRQTIIQIRDVYHQNAGKPLKEIAGNVRKQGGGKLPEPLVGAGADMATKGYVTPENVQKLRDIGVTVPKHWQGTPVRAHSRKPRSR